MRIFLKRVILKNYRSIASCDIELPALCFLVGKNGAGKSNFIDALRLVSDSLNTSLDHALRERGGIDHVRRRSSGHPTNFGIRLEFELPDDRCGFYAFIVGAMPNGGFEVLKEECRVFHQKNVLNESVYVVKSGKVEYSSVATPPSAKSDRLYLVNMSGFDEFRTLYDMLSRMGFYNLNPDVIRNEQPPDVGVVLKRDGSNIASVLERMRVNAPENKKLIEEFLSKVVPNIHNVDPCTVLSKETLEFRQAIKGSQETWRFYAVNMSDGTLRALGILIALFQGATMKENPTPLVGIEEPESALHPAAAGVLRDALKSASERVQVLVTSHSPDLLDDKSIDAASILAVSNEDGVTSIMPIDEAGRTSIHNGLYTAGELLRIDQLAPDSNKKRGHNITQTDLFKKTIKEQC